MEDLPNDRLAASPIKARTHPARSDCHLLRSPRSLSGERHDVDTGGRAGAGNGLCAGAWLRGTTWFWQVISRLDGIST